MTRMFVKAKIRMAKAFEDREAGQGTLEYLGMVVVAAILIIAVIIAFKNYDFASILDGKLGEIESNLG